MLVFNPKRFKQQQKKMGQTWMVHILWNRWRRNSIITVQTHSKIFIKVSCSYWHIINWVSDWVIARLLVSSIKYILRTYKEDSNKFNVLRRKFIIRYVYSVHRCPPFLFCCHTTQAASIINEILSKQIIRLALIIFFLRQNEENRIYFIRCNFYLVYQKAQWCNY